LVGVKKLPAIEPWHPAPYIDADSYAIKALATGTANEGQQKRALDWIINTLCATYDLSYRPGSDRDTAFAEGKRHVGLQIVKQVNVNLK
jgi:hypothetical protein